MNKHTKVIAPIAAVLCALLLVVVAVPRSTGSHDVPGEGGAAPVADEAPASTSADLADAAEAALPDEGAPSGGDRPAYDADTVLVSLADGASVDDLLASFEAPAAPALAGSVVEKQAESYVKLALPAGSSAEEALAQLEENDLVESAQFNYFYYPAGSSSARSLDLTAIASSSNALSTQASAKANDPYYAKGKQWSLDSVNFLDACDLVNAGAKATSAVTVAVIDSGFLVNHQDLKDHVVDYYDAAAGSTTMGTDNSTHGTHVAGIVSAVTNNKKGVASVANNALGLMLLRVSDKEGGITSDTIVDAYSYLTKRAKTHNVRVVNMSLGGGSKSPVDKDYDVALYNAIAKAKKAGIVTVAAACNEESGFTPPFFSFPSDFDNVVSVINLKKSSNDDGVERDSSSNYNTPRSRTKTEKNISAPGTGIYSTYSTSKTSYKMMDGTSMASPLVAGVLGLMFTVNPDLTAAQATSKLYSSAKDLTVDPAGEGWDRETGWGEVDAAAAVQAASTATLSATSKKSVASLSISVADATYTGKALKPKVTVKNGSTTLKQGSDYTVAYRDNTAVGKAAFTVRGKGDYCGIAVGSFTIGQAALKTAALKATTAVYDGKSHKPAVKSVKIASGAITSANYTVKYLRNGSATSNFKNVGAITVKVTGKNNCKGAVVKTFTVKPKGVSNVKLTSARKGFAAKWKAQAKQTSGLQLQLATNKAFTSNVKSFRKAKPSLASCTVSNLKAKKTYYVRIRTYKVANGATYYSDWSKVRSVKTK